MINPRKLLVDGGCKLREKTKLFDVGDYRDLINVTK